MLAQAVAAITLLVLVASGVAKMIDPKPSAGALNQARLPHGMLAVRTLALTEIGAGIIGLVVGGVWLLPAILLYGSFTLFVWLAWQKHLPLQSCGCFGREDTPPTAVHFIYNLVASVSLLFGLAVGTTPIGWSNSTSEIMLQLTFGAIGAYLSYLVLAELPRTLNQANT